MPPSPPPPRGAATAGLAQANKAVDMPCHTLKRVEDPTHIPGPGGRRGASKDAGGRCAHRRQARQSARCRRGQAPGPRARVSWAGRRGEAAVRADGAASYRGQHDIIPLARQYIIWRTTFRHGPEVAVRHRMQVGRRPLEGGTYTVLGGEDAGDTLTTKHILTTRTNTPHFRNGFQQQHLHDR